MGASKETRLQVADHQQNLMGAANQFCICRVSSSGEYFCRYCSCSSNSLLKERLYITFYVE